MEQLAQTAQAISELRQRRRHRLPSTFYMADLIDLLREVYGLTVTPLDIRHLERDGVLPRPRRGIEGDRQWSLHEIEGAVDIVRRHVDGATP